MKKLLLLLALALVLTGCTQPGISMPDGTQPDSTEALPPVAAVIDPAEIFSDGDQNTEITGKTAHITLSGDTASCDSNAVKIDGATVTITDEGTYILSGALANGQIRVDADKSDKTRLVFSGVDIHCDTSAAIYIRQADKVTITLAEGTENSLSGGEAYENTDSTNIDAALFSKVDLTLNGQGTVTVTAPAGHGIVCKKDLRITGGTYTVTGAAHGITAENSLGICQVNLTVTAGKDAVHVENTEDTALGYGYLESGSYTLTAQGDGISASNALVIAGGSYKILTGGGAENAPEHESGFGPGGGPGGRPRSGAATTDTSGEDTSCKGIKAAAQLQILGGAFQMDCADDALHSNANVTVAGGEFDIATGDDALHADDTLTVTAGTLRISESYEGLEGQHILVSGGDIHLIATDDGINAAGGNDGSGTGGFFGGDRFGGPVPGGATDGSITISGGTLYIQASGDGMDANGSVLISGGETTVCGPTQGDTATLDYETTATITGGTFIGTGARGMAQTFSDSQQGVLSVSVGNAQAGTEILLTDSGGRELLRFRPALSFHVVIISTPELQKGEAYTLTAGTSSGSITAQ